MLWDISGGGALAGMTPLRDVGGIVRTLAFSPDDAVLASGDRDHKVLLWSVSGDHSVRALRPDHSGEVWSVAFSPDNHVLATAGADGKVMLRLWDRDSLIATRMLGGTVRAVSYDSKERLIVAAGDVDVGIHGTYSGQTRPSEQSFPTGLLPSTLRQEGTSSRQGMRLETSFCGTDSRRRDFRRYAVAGRLRASVSFDATGAVAAAGFDDGTVTVWERPAGPDSVERHLDVEGVVWDLDFSPDGSLLALSGGTDSVVIWNLRDDTEQRFVASSEVVTSVAFDPAGTTLAVGGSDGDVLLIDVTTGRRLGASMSGHQGTVQDVEFDATGDFLAVSQFRRQRASLGRGDSSCDRGFARRRLRSHPQCRLRGRRTRSSIGRSRWRSALGPPADDSQGEGVRRCEPQSHTRGVGHVPGERSTV